VAGASRDQWERRLAPILTDRYVEVVLECEFATVISASEGTRNDQLNRSAFALARLGRGGQLSPKVFVSRLTSGALATGLGEGEIRLTLASALKGRTLRTNSTASWPT
jgi:hypothetical protein